MSRIMPFAMTMLKNLLSPPVTKNYPESPAVYPERSRGHIEITVDECISCGLCVRSCPTGALEVDKAAGSWTINRFDCIACGYCVEKCPKKCLHMVPGYQEPMMKKSLASYQKSPEVMAAEAARKAEAAKKAAAARAAREAKKKAEEAGKMTDAGVKESGVPAENAGERAVSTENKVKAASPAASADKTEVKD